MRFEIDEDYKSRVLEERLIALALMPRKEDEWFKVILSPTLRDIYIRFREIEKDIRTLELERRLNIIGEDETKRKLFSIIGALENLIDDITYVVRRTYKNGEVVAKFEKRMENFKKKIEKTADIMEKAIAKEKKERSIETLFTKIISMIKDYTGRVFDVFRQNLVIESDVWEPMHKKFSEIATERIGIIPEVEEEKKKGEEL